MQTRNRTLIGIVAAGWGCRCRKLRQLGIQVVNFLLPVVPFLLLRRNLVLFILQLGRAVRVRSVVRLDVIHLGIQRVGPLQQIQVHLDRRQFFLGIGDGAFQRLAIAPACRGNAPAPRSPIRRSRWRSSSRVTRSSSGASVIIGRLPYHADRSVGLRNRIVIPHARGLRLILLSFTPLLGGRRQGIGWRRRGFLRVLRRG